MELGAFSVSLAVKDVEASKRFYEKPGFAVFMGDQSQNWLMMKNGGHVASRHVRKEHSHLTGVAFNPGWNSEAQPLKEFTDVREL